MWRMANSRSVSKFYLKNSCWVGFIEQHSKRVGGQLKDLDIPSVNAALGYLTRVVLLLSKYFMVGTFSIFQQVHFQFLLLPEIIHF